MGENASDTKAKLREAETKIRAAEAALKEMRANRVRQSLWSAAAGIALFAVAGQWFPGYQLDSTAEAAADKQAANAVIGVMAELCAERFTMTTVGLDSRVAALNEVNGDWNKAKHLLEGTWVDTPEGEKSNHATAEMCLNLIGERLSRDSGQPS